MHRRTVDPGEILVVCMVGFGDEHGHRANRLAKVAPAMVMVAASSNDITPIWRQFYNASLHPP